MITPHDKAGRPTIRRTLTLGPAMQGKRATTQASWPKKSVLFGVPLTLTTYEAAVNSVVDAARHHRGGCVSGLAVHGLITAYRDSAFRRMVSGFEMLTCDGQPVRLAMNVVTGARMNERVSGTDLMERLCMTAAAEGLPIYLYGSHRRVTHQLAERLRDRHAELRIVGVEPSLFRPIDDAEMNELAARVLVSGARLVFVGLGCPIQERFATRLRRRTDAVVVCSGAAFDFLAGNKRRAPLWMQRYCLEWLFRLCCEPRRLLPRYLATNFTFLWLCLSRSLLKR